MGRYLLLWMLGIPLPILVLIYMFGGCTDIVARMSEANPGTDATHSGLRCASSGLRNRHNKKGGPFEAAFSVSFR